MSEYVEVTIVGRYEVTPGSDGYPSAVDADGCARADADMYLSGLLGVLDLLGFMDCLSVSFRGKP